MLEILVALSCLYGTGCSEAAASYYQTSAQLQAAAKYSEQRLKHHMGERTLAGVTAVALLATGQQWHTQIYSNVTVGGQKWDRLSLSYTYRW
jgi:hypothetical protein